MRLTYSIVLGALFLTQAGCTPGFFILGEAPIGVEGYAVESQGDRSTFYRTEVRPGGPAKVIPKVHVELWLRGEKLDEQDTTDGRFYVGQMLPAAVPKPSTFRVRARAPGYMPLDVELRIDVQAFGVIELAKLQADRAPPTHHPVNPDT